MGIDGMRMNSGRCPSFLVIGLILMCILLTCNWWTLSSQNYDLMKELEDLGDQLRICSDVADACKSERIILETKVRSSENAVGAMEIKLSQFSDSDDKLKICGAELESMKQLDESRAGILSLLRMEKESLSQQNQERMDTIQKLTKELEKIKTTKITPQAAAETKSSISPLISMLKGPPTAPTPETTFIKVPEKSTEIQDIFGQKNSKEDEQADDPSDNDKMRFAGTAPDGEML